MIRTPIRFGEDGFIDSGRFQEVKNQAFEHLLTRIEEMGTEFARWNSDAIRTFVDSEVNSFVRTRLPAVYEPLCRRCACLRNTKAIR